MKANVSRPTLIAAYVIGICADLIQVCLTPFLSEGFASPFNDVLDVVVCVILSRLIGFHVAFLPSFLIKLIPLVEIAPTWTLAVFISTRHLRAPIVDVPATDSGKPDVAAEDEKPPKILREKNG
jgi:hypothetical protein